MELAQKKTRRQMLEEFLAAHPADTFSRYALAMECSNTGDFEAAIGHFRTLIQHQPNYVPAYQMLGQLLARLQRKEEAREILLSGIAAARTAGNSHAASEMEAFLEELALSDRQG